MCLVLSGVFSRFVAQPDAYPPRTHRARTLVLLKEKEGSMKHGIRLLALLASLIGLVSFASAATVGGPTQGLWYNPQESGRGYDIDLQGDTMIVTTYVYEQSGDPIWYLSSGPYDHNTGIFASTYDSYSGGQCFGCPYHAPTAQSGAAGPITITFHTNQTATLTFNGGSTEIVKYAYGYGTRTDVLYGEWALSYEYGGVVAGDWIVFDTTSTDSTGAVFASGHAAGAPTTTALGIYDPLYQEAQIEVTQGTTTRLYRFGVFDDRRLIGNAAVTLQGQPSQGPYVATGARLLYKSEIAGGIIGTTAQQAKAADAATFASENKAIHERMRRAAAVLEAAKH